MKVIKPYFIKLALLLSFCLLMASPSNAQFTRGSQMTFGKNRVQYNDFLWTFYRFKNFDTYFYLGGQELAVYTGRTADDEIADIEKLFDYRINGRFQFIIYNRLSDLKQSNIGLDGEEVSTNTGGLTRIVGNKVLIYFDGDYDHFRQQIRAGVAQVMINQLMYGGSVRDRLSSAVLLNLPDWYVKGLIEYVATGWTTEDDNRMRDGVNSGRYRKLNKLAANETVFAGKSLWNFIVDSYGSSSISNLLYMTRINRNIESGFIYVVGANLKEVDKSWNYYYQRLYLDDDKSRSNPNGKAIITVKKATRTVNQVKISPDGNQIAYVTNELGKYKLWLYDVRRDKKKVLSKGGYKSLSQTPDISFPVLSWHPSGRYVSALREKKGKIWLDYYNIGKKVKRETNKFFYFDKVLDFSYNSSGNEMVLSAIQKGQSDIYTFNPRTKVIQQLTKDRWDDFQPRYVMNDRYIAFSSTRIGDSLKPTSLVQLAPLETSNQKDIYLFDAISKSEQLLNLTNTPTINESRPYMADSTHFTFLSDENGITNRYYATLDSTIAYIDTVIHYRYIVNAIPQTNYSRSIIEHDLNYRSTKYAELVRKDSKLQIYLNQLRSFDSTFKSPLPKTALRQKLDKAKKPVAVKKNQTPIKTPDPINLFDEIKTNLETKDSTKIDINNYQFQSEFPSKKEKQKQAAEAKPLSPEQQEIKNSIGEAAKTIVNIAKKELLNDSVAVSVNDTALYQLPKKRNYDVAFATSYFLTQLDNSLLNETYQTYTGGAVFFNPGLNALIKLGVNDLFDDYRITGGFRISGNLNSNEYFVSYENLKSRMDKQISFYRQAREEITRDAYLKIHTHELKYVSRWPLNDLTSIRGTIAYRNDRTVNLSTDILNLIEDNAYENWASGRLEFVYDNTINTGVNLYNGFRYKLFGELYQQVDGNKGYLSVLGADFRHYLKLSRQIIWANRFAASTSLGSEKLIYYLGWTDNSFTPSDNFNENIQVDQTKNYAFQALATSLRGFTQNIRNGNSFALINSELRIPLFQYFTNQPIRSDFIRNFQVVGFADIGTAWTGTSPYSKTNSLFRKEYPGNPIDIVVTKDIEPIVAGYGFGLRSRLLGYFMRADWAWGVDDGVVQPRIFYFSLGLDF